MRASMGEMGSGVWWYGGDRDAHPNGRTAKRGGEESSTRSQRTRSFLVLLLDVRVLYVQSVDSLIRKVNILKIN